MMEYLRDDELMHYGKKGMKWKKRGRKAVDSAKKTITKARVGWARKTIEERKARAHKVRKDRSRKIRNNTKVNSSANNAIKKWKNQTKKERAARKKQIYNSQSHSF